MLLDYTIGLHNLKTNLNNPTIEETLKHYNTLTLYD